MQAIFLHGTNEELCPLFKHFGIRSFFAAQYGEGNNLRSYYKTNRAARSGFSDST